MKLRSFVLSLLLAAPAGPLVALVARAATPLAEAARLEEGGHFVEAAAVLKQALAGGNLLPAQRREATFELDRLERIRKDFALTREELFAALKKSVRDLTPAEFDAWVEEGRFDARTIDGVARYMVSSVSNLYWRHPELNGRRLQPKDDSAYQQGVWEDCQAIRRAARRTGQPYVLPKRFEATMSVTADANVASEGEIVRCWLPVPRGYPFQTGLVVVSGSPLPRQLAEEGSPIRSAYFEREARKGEAPEFRLTYRYTTHAIRFEVQPDLAEAYDGGEPALAAFTNEAPHIVFTPEMRALSARILGGETNPVRVARKFYDWVSENIKYSYAIEYSTIRNLGDYCRARGYGDCGQEALLFMTLCRLNGIPARWQSGWYLYPGQKNLHDWCEIYLAPWGWVPVDNWMGIFATRYATSLTAAQRKEVRDFYFGGLDAWRLAANSDHCQPLTPPRQTFRSDPVDFQRGELEAGGRNLYFDQFKYRLDVRELPIETAP